MAVKASRPVALIALLLVVVALVAAYSLFSGAGSGAKEQAVLTVGDQRGGAQALLQAAGELDDVPYKIEWALFPAASPLLEALNAGAVDIGGVGGAPFAFAYAGGANIKAVGAYRPSGPNAGRVPAIVVRGDSELKTFADLRGARLATIRGSIGQDIVLRLFGEAGLDPSTVDWAYLNNGESSAALNNKSVDAWSTWGSYVGIAVIENGNRVLADARDLPSTVGFVAASDRAIETKRALLSDYLARLGRARQWAQENPDAYAKVLARETKIPVEVAKFAILADVGDMVPINEQLIDEQREIFERYRAINIIDAVPDIEAAYDQSFHPAAASAPPS